MPTRHMQVKIDGNSENAILLLVAFLTRFLDLLNIGASGPSKIWVTYISERNRNP